MIKHTDPPWFFECDEEGMHVSHTGTLCNKTTVCTVNTGNPKDGVLLAAAPDLLEALEMLVDWWLKDGSKQFFGAPGGIFKAREAIAKAKGES